MKLFRLLLARGLLTILISTARNKVIELWCAIDKEERGKGYGTDILGKMTIYLIEKFDDIRLVIERII